MDWELEIATPSVGDQYYAITGQPQDKSIEIRILARPRWVSWAEVELEASAAAQSESGGQPHVCVCLLLKALDVAESTRSKTRLWQFSQ